MSTCDPGALLHAIYRDDDDIAPKENFRDHGFGSLYFTS